MGGSESLASTHRKIDGILRADVLCRVIINSKDQQNIIITHYCWIKTWVFTPKTLEMVSVSSGCLRRSLTCQRLGRFLENILLRTSPPAPFTEANLEIDYQAVWGEIPGSASPPFPSNSNFFSNSPISLISCILAPPTPANSKSLILKFKSLRITITWRWIFW